MFAGIGVWGGFSGKAGVWKIDLKQQNPFTDDFHEGFMVVQHIT